MSSPFLSKVAINNSISKQMYSFYNSPRFTLREKSSDCFYYDLPPVLSPRAASMGIGSKVDFGKLSSHSNNKQYNAHNLNATMYRSPSYSFGFGRDQCKNYMQLVEGIRPEPTTYNIKPMFGCQTMKYSIRKKLGNKALHLSPGPGTYNSIDFKANGYYPVSQVVNCLHLPFSKAKEVRFTCKSQEIMPTPATYMLQSSFNGNGREVLSQYQSNIAKTMGAKKKECLSVKVSPGPGHYAHFSSFSGFHS